MKKTCVLFIFLIYSLISFSQSFNRKFKLDNGNFLRVSCLSDQIFRFQLNAVDTFPVSSMEKYGIVKHQWEENKKCKIGKKAGKVVFETPNGKLSVDIHNGTFSLTNSAGQSIMEVGHPLKARYNGGFGVSFDLQKDELFYGLGDTDREHLQHRGHLMRSWVSYGQAYAPAPFIMSSKGWAIFVNTTFKHYYDVGKSDPDKMNIWGENGKLDIFLMLGDNYKELLYQYTELTGRPRLLPQKAYGLMFVENREVNQFELLEHATKFRSEKIPCDYLGLEPGWMETFRDPTVNIDWDYKKFFMPAWFGEKFRTEKHGQRTFIGGLGRIGFNLSLWTLCEFDITHEAERQAQKDFPELYQKKINHFFPEVDESNFDTRAHEPRYFNKNTVVNEAWFEHFKLFLKDGVRAFKQDPAYIINEHPDWYYGNGMNNDEMHNLFQPMYQKQVYEGWKNFLNERPMFYFCTGYAGVQHWAPTWAGDEGGTENALASMLNQGMTAHSNVSCDMYTFSKEGIHFGFLQAWSQINSWWDIRYPWFLGDLENMFKYYARLRYRLMPYIYTYAHVSNQTSVPMMRPMPLEYPDDHNCEDLLTQYLLGDYLLVSAFSDKIYLPKGKWIDYWSHKEFEGKQELTLDILEDKGGGLFIKAGAIIPEWPYVDYVGQKEIDTLTVQVYPYKKSNFTLIEDEGEGFGYENGEIATTKMECEESDKEIVFIIHKTGGNYKGMVKARKYIVNFNLSDEPRSVMVNSEVYTDWKYDSNNKVISVTNLSNNGPKITILY